MNEFNVNVEVLPEDFVVSAGILNITDEVNARRDIEELRHSTPSLRFRRKKAELERRRKMTATQRVREDLTGLAIAGLMKLKPAI